MKILSRDFTPREKIMILILVLVLLALCYYQFLYVPCVNAIDSANARSEALKTELLAAQMKEGKLKQMQNELDSLGELNLTSRMGSYNNSKAELSLLNHVLESANDYAVSFTDVTRDGDQIRRNFSLQFTARDFDAVKVIIDKLTQSEYRCLIGNVSYHTVQNKKTAKNVMENTVERVIDGVTYYEYISVTATATFFETMYDGTPDAGLPPEDPKKK